MVDRVSTAFDSSFVIDIYQPRAPGPNIEALHMRAVYQVCSLVEHVAIERIVAERQRHS